MPIPSPDSMPPNRPIRGRHVPAICFAIGLLASCCVATAAADPTDASVDGTVAQSAARELGPKNIHVAHLIIDAGVDTAFVRERIKAREGEAALDNLPEGRLMRPEAIADAYWALYQQPRDGWSFEHEIRPFAEKW